MTLLLVVVGGAAGAVVRALVARAFAARSASGQPPRTATLLVNLAGSLLLGLVAGSGATTYALLAVGFCGALTTFSTYAVEVLEGGGARYALVSTVGCLAACALGLAAADVLR